MGCINSQPKEFPEWDDIPTSDRLHAERELTFQSADSITKFTSAMRTSLFARDDYDPLTYHPRSLTKKEKEGLRAAWKSLTEMPDPIKTVVNASVRMFVLAPESIRTFTFLREVSVSNTSAELKALLKTTVMRKHFRLVFSFLQMAIDNLDNENFETVTEDLGEWHHDHGARPEFLKILCDGFVFAFEKTLWPEVDSALIHAWETFFARLAYDWARGHLRASERLPSQLQTQSPTGGVAESSLTGNKDKKGDEDDATDPVEEQGSKVVDFTPNKSS